jgi:hypothetical protein
MWTVKDQRRTECIRKAYELARSGRHKDDLTIEAALAATYPEARRWLTSWIRDALRQLCELERNEAGQR